MDSKTFTTTLSKTLATDSKEIMAMTEALSSAITAALCDRDRVAIPSFGSFETRKEDEKIVTDAITGKRILLPPVVEICFMPATSLLKKQ